VGRVLIQLFPEVVGSIAMPSWAMLVLALLSSGRGVVEAIALVSGVTAVRLLQGILFSSLLSAYELSHHLSGQGAIVSALLVVLGVLMLVMAVKQVVQKKNDLKLMRMVDALTPVKALGLGVVLAATSTRAWIFTLAALAVIEQAGLDFAQSVVAYLLYVLGAEVLLVAPILVSARSSVRFEAAARRLEEYSRPIVVVVSVAVGCFFLWRGITGLIG
jgi:cytochrome c biogenesis protein CcdA